MARILNDILFCYYYLFIFFFFIHYFIYLFIILFIYYLFQSTVVIDYKEIFLQALLPVVLINKSRHLF